VSTPDSPRPPQGPLRSGNERSGLTPSTDTPAAALVPAHVRWPRIIPFPASPKPQTRSACAASRRVCYDLTQRLPEATMVPG
jgi:hypothetical protein